MKGRSGLPMRARRASPTYWLILLLVLVAIAAVLISQIMDSESGAAQGLVALGGSVVADEPLTLRPQTPGL